VENEIPAKALVVDVVRPVKTAGPEAGKEVRKAEVSAAAPPPEVLARMPQIVYLDASLLQKQSVRYFRYLASQARNSPYQCLEFWPFRIQWCSSG